MNEDTFNRQTRKFLKKVGIASQREIERAVREGLERGTLKGDEKMEARVRLSIPALDLSLDVEDDIALE